jgi:hypothetical protein
MQSNSTNSRGVAYFGGTPAIGVDNLCHSICACVRSRASPQLNGSRKSSYCSGDTLVVQVVSDVALNRTTASAKEQK